MTKQLSARIRLIYGIVLSVAIAIAAVCLMAACLSIYNLGSHPFTRETVAEAFSEIAAPVYLCLALTVGGCLLDLLLPNNTAKLTAGKQNKLVLKRLHSKTDLNLCEETLRGAILSQQKSRALHTKIRTVLLACAAAAFLAYALNPSNFHQSDINASMIQAMLVLLPCLALSFGYAVFTAYHNNASMEKEIALLNQAGPEARCVPSPEAAHQSPVKLGTVRTVLLAVAVVLLVYGFFAGGTADVLTKAVNICTECVGLG